MRVSSLFLASLISDFVPLHVTLFTQMLSIIQLSQALCQMDLTGPMCFLVVPSSTSLH